MSPRSSRSPRPRASLSFLVAPWILAATVVVAGCSRGVPVGRAPARADAGALRGAVALRDPTAVYERAGLVAAVAPIPFAGWVRFLAGPTPDSALALVAFSFPARAFSFERSGEGYRARYDVVVEFRRGGEVVRRIEARETVRVGSYRETGREEESVIFQQFAVVASGGYTMFVTVRDSLAGRESGAVQGVIAPRFDATNAAALVPVFRATPRRTNDELPRLVANPRATAVAGRDTAALFYVETYGARAGDALRLRVVGEPGRAPYDTMLAAAAAPTTSVLGRVVALPVSPLDLGLARVELGRAAAPTPALATTPLLVTLGDALVVASLDEVLDYLRWFADPERLAAIRDTTPAARVATWSRFLRETDPDPAPPDHEALRAYLTRLEAANARFREEGTPGWLTDRGMVFAALGEPDRVREPPQSPTGPQLRTQQWEYDALRARLVFVDRSGLGAWRLTTGSEAEFRAAVKQRRTRGVS